ncbi:MAG: hypothetical protein KDN19_08840 [Verrucomicrobiae bacterium]|nr:hypothetical protein [Verrucomicrobiae bacterium]
MTGPCPKCGATIVAPQQSVSPQESGGQTAAHHEDPASGRKNGYQSLRRRRTRVEPPKRDLRPISGGNKAESEGETDGGDDEVATPFSGVGNEAPESPDSPLASDLEVSAAEEEPKKTVARPPSFLSGGVAGMAFPGVVSNPGPKTPVSEEAVEPDSEIQTEPGLAASTAPKTFARPPIDLKRSISRQPEPVPAKVEEVPETGAEEKPFEETAPSVKELDEAPPVLEEETKIDAGADEEVASLDDLPEEPPASGGFWPWQKKSKPVEPVAKEVAPEEREQETPAEMVPQSEPVSAEDEEKGSREHDFEWLLTKDERVPDGSEPNSPREAPRAMVDPETDLDEMFGSASESAETDTTPPPAPGPFPKWSSLESAGGLDSLIGIVKTPPASGVADEAPPLVEDPWKKPDPVSSKAEDSSEKATAGADPWTKPLPPTGDAAVGPPPLDDEEATKNPEAIEESIPVMLRSSRLREGAPLAQESPGDAENSGGLSLRVPPREKKIPRVEDPAQAPPSDLWGSSNEMPARKPEPAAIENDAIAATPWLAPQLKRTAAAAAATEDFAETSPETETPPPMAEDKEETVSEDTLIGGTSEDVPPPMAEEEEDLPPPIAQLPRFLGGAPVAESHSPASTAASSSSAPPLPETAPTQAPQDDFAKDDEPMLSFPASGDFGAPPMLNMQAFGEGEPPRPGDRAAAPGQQIRLPQIADTDSGSVQAKAIVSPITGETMKPFAPLDDGAAEMEKVEAPEAPDFEESKIASLSDRLPQSSKNEENPPKFEAEGVLASNADISASSIGELIASEVDGQESDEKAIPGDPGEFISARARVAAASIARQEKERETEEKDASTASEIPPPVTPEVVSVPVMGKSPFQKNSGEPSAPPLDVETEEGDFEEGGPEDMGMARILGLMPRGRENEVETPVDSDQSTPKAAKTQAQSAKSKAPEFPSIDDVLDGKAKAHPTPEKGPGMIDGLKKTFETMDGRRKKLVIGGTVAATLAVVAAVGFGSGWFRGSDDDVADGESEGTPKTIQTDSGSVAAKGEGATAAANPESGQPSQASPKSETELPKANQVGGGNKLVIVDSGDAGAAQTPTPVEDRPKSSAPNPPSMTSLIPDGNKPASDRAADVATGVAWASGPNEDSSMAAPGAKETEPSVGNGEKPGGTETSSTDLVLPTVGAVAPATGDVDPLVAEGSSSSAVAAVGGNSEPNGGGYTEIGGAGEDGNAPTGSPVVTTDEGDPEKALSRQEERLQSVAPIAGADSGVKPNLDNPVEAAKYTLQKFLSQPDWEDRMEFVYDAERLKPRIRAYYQTADDGPITESVAKFFDMDEKPADGGDPFYAFYLFLEGVEAEFPVVVRKTADGYKVDWELFVECKDRLFAEFKNSGKEGPATFRFVMQRHSYWGPDRETFANSNDYLCYKIEPPYPDAEAFVFVAKDAPIAAETEKLATWGLPPVDVVLTLELKEFPHGAKHYVIKSLDKPSWVAP